MDALHRDRIRLLKARIDAASRRGRCDIEGCEADVAPMSVLSYTAAAQVGARSAGKSPDPGGG
ncbi:hypothetical protein [Lysobacter sp. HA18]